jgi:hypothetical protein
MASAPSRHLTCPVCKRTVEPDPLVLGPVWCDRCIKDEINRDRGA